MEGDYNYYIVSLSVLIAVLASYAALNNAAKISSASGKNKYFWLLSGSLVMGAGIWSMHFIGMLAFHMPMMMKYDIGLTIISMLASVVSSVIAFYITMPVNVNKRKIVAGGFFMGSGIVAMHYIGMEAMIMPGSLTYNPWVVSLSIVIAFIASYAALFLFLRFRHQSSSSLLKWLSAVLMGAAICGMHYTGMAAASFHAQNEMVGGVSEVDPFLLYGVTVTIFVILFVSWSAIFLDRHLLEKLAYLDSLTGLPNRNEMYRFFMKYSSGETISVLFLDLDQFKAINDTLGHDIGDCLVRDVSVRLREFVSGGTEAFRIGGDEFLIVMKRGGPKQAEQLATNIIQSIKKVYTIEGHDLYITASIGISIGSVMEADTSALLKEADTAMYKAKGLGKNRYCVYNEEMGRKEVRRMELEKDIRIALEHNQFHLVYQPKWNVSENRLCGFEALLRWDHPRLGSVPPVEFIPIAEDTGAIIPITRWVLEQACIQSKVWERQGISDPVSVNLSVRLFQLDSLSEWVESVLEKTELSPHLLELEITESMVLHDVSEVISQLQSIRSLGVKVSMDDFGTGYSSIGLLDRIPIDAIKLDRLFTKDLETPTKRAIINAIVLMAKNLKLDVIAEGVENEEHVNNLTQLGCNIMQGYYYSKPMKVDEMDAWLEDRNLFVRMNPV